MLYLIYLELSAVFLTSTGNGWSSVLSTSSSFRFRNIPRIIKSVKIRKVYREFEHFLVKVSLHHKNRNTFIWTSSPSSANYAHYACNNYTNSYANSYANSEISQSMSICCCLTAGAIKGRMTQNCKNYN